MMKTQYVNLYVLERKNLKFAKKKFSKTKKNFQKCCIFFCLNRPGFFLIIFFWQLSVLSAYSWHYNYLSTSKDPWQRDTLKSYKFKDAVYK